MIKASILVSIAIAIIGSLFSSATVVKPNAQIALGSESGTGSGSGESEKQSSSSSDKNEKQSKVSNEETGGSVSESEAEEIEKETFSSSSNEDKKKQLDDDEKKIQDDEKQVEADEKQVQADVAKLESDEKQIKIELSPQETVVQGSGPQNLQNPSIQQSLEASKQPQPNPGKLATPPNVLLQYKADQRKLRADQAKLTSDLGKLQADQNNYATHINALAFDIFTNSCKPTAAGSAHGSALCKPLPK